MNSDEKSSEDQLFDFSKMKETVVSIYGLISEGKSSAISHTTIFFLKLHFKVD